MFNFSLLILLILPSKLRTHLHTFRYHTQIEPAIWIHKDQFWLWSSHRAIFFKPPGAVDCILNSLAASLSSLLPLLLYTSLHTLPFPKWTYIWRPLEPGRDDGNLRCSDSQWEGKPSYWSTLNALLCYCLIFLPFFISPKLPLKCFRGALTSTHSPYSHLLLSTEKLHLYGMGVREGVWER